MTKFVVIDELDGWLPREVVKHGSHNQKDHGRSGGAREVSAKDVDSAWDAVLSDEARTIDNPKKAHPEKYDAKGKLKDDEVETRRVQGEGPPRVRDYETNESAGLSWSEAAKVEGALGLSQTGDFTMRVPIGPERPPQHVYRVMSTEEFDQARQRGYIKSDERMNLASGEGTVTSLRSTGDFYAPVDGSDYRIVRIKYDDADGWRTDTIDSYIKTQERVPFDRVDLYSSPLTNPRVVKHGSHDLPEGWSSETMSAGLAKQEARIIVEETVTKAVYVAFEPGLRPVLKHIGSDSLDDGLRDSDQISIWDVANLEEINTGGTGKVGKAVAGSETAGPVQDDGSGDRRVRKESVGEGGGAVVVAFEPGLRPVLKHGSHDQSSHGRRGGGGGDAASAIEQLRGVPGRYTPPGGGTMRGQNFDTDEPKSRRSAGKTWQEEYEEQREAIAQALVTGDYSNLGLPDSPLASSLGSAVGRVERRIARVAERVGIRRKKRWQFTEEQATRLRESYYERYGRPSWMGKAFKIIRKHLGGAHDQKSHGRGGGGKSGWGDRQKDIDAMASAGPSRYALETAVGGGISDDEVRERIAEDFSESIEEQAREAVQQSMDDEGWVDVTTLDESDPRYDPDGPLMGPTYQEEFESRMAQARDEITESYVYDYGDEYRNQAQADAGIDPDTFNEVYGVTHVGVNADGVEVTMTAQVENVYVDPYGDGIVVSGNVYDQDGNIATSDSWERKIYMENGELVAENALLTLEPEYRGLGFAKTFNTTAENYYISHGIDKVNVHAALDVGGYAWAKQGFDWAPKGGATWTVKGQFDDVLSDPSLPASVRRSGVELRARLDLPNYDRDYPTPREVASWGYVQGASTWPGKQALLGSDWYGQKRLTPSGPRLSTTQQEAANQPAAAPELPGQMTLPGVVS